MTTAEEFLNLLDECAVRTGADRMPRYEQLYAAVLATLTTCASCGQTGIAPARERQCEDCARNAAFRRATLGE